MRRGSLITFVLLVFLLTLGGAAYADEPPTEPCHPASAGGTALRAILALAPGSGRLSIDFRRDDSSDELSATFTAANCLVIDAAGLSVELVPTQEGRPIPDAAVVRKLVIPKANEVVVTVALDPTKLKAGTYSADITVVGDTVFTASARAKVTRSDPRFRIPISAVIVGCVIGLLIAAYGVLKTTTLSTDSLKYWYIGIAVAVAAYLVSQVYVDEYANALIWQPSFAAWKDLAVKAGSAASGGTVVGLLAKAIGKKVAEVRAARARAA
jgi:hypothetical protein